MSSFVFEPAPRPALPVQGSDALFPVRRIFCIARNYADHAREMGQDPDREPPFFFTKPGDGVVPVPFGQEVDWRYPLATQDLHHEVEMVVALKQGGEKLSPEHAAQCIFGYGIGLDLTRRDLQAEAKAKNRPWDLAKGFDESAPISTLVPVEQCGTLQQGKVSLAINGQTRQQGDLSDMIWQVPEIIALISQYFTLQAGDLIFTGTPAGVAPMFPGDQVLASVAGVGELKLKVVAR